MNSLFSFLCAAGAAAAWPWVALYYAIRARTDGKYGRSRRFRLGLAVPDFTAADPVWIHALSVGETLSALPLVMELRQRLPAVPLVFSVGTESGYRIATARLSNRVETVFFLPHDFPWAVEKLLHRLSPRAFILVETDLWPNLLLGLKRRGIPSVCVNARLSPKSHKRFRRFRPFAAALYGLMDAVFTQSREDRKRLAALGVSRGRLHVCGNLKFDLALLEAPETDGAALRRRMEIPLERPVWIAGSTHPGEESVLLEAHAALRRELDDPLLILAPRHIQRAAQIIALCRERGFPTGRRSLEETARGRSIFLLDSLGELARFYAAADTAFIGGSLVPFGGHNPLEAAVHGTPCLWGPHLFNFREIESLLLERGCGERVRNAGDIRDKCLERLQGPAFRRRTGEACRRAVYDHAGTAGRIVGRLCDGGFFRRRGP